MLRSQLLKLVMVIFLFFFSSASARNAMHNRNIMQEAAARSLSTFNVFQPKSYSNHYGLQVYINKYNRMQESKFQLIKTRDKATLQLISKVFRSYKLPAELKYLAIVESELKDAATSKVGAAGVWQLMPKTAMDLGLTVDSTMDERRNIHKSTKAAALYLRDLHRTFKDWSLAIAAYNCGPGPVYKAIKKAGSRNYWDLQEFLPKETRLHVRKVMATQVYFEGKATLAGNYDAVMPVGISNRNQPNIHAMAGSTGIKTWFNFNFSIFDKNNIPKAELPLVAAASTNIEISSAFQTLATLSQPRSMPVLNLF